MSSSIGNIIIDKKYWTEYVIECIDALGYNYSDKQYSLSMNIKELCKFQKLCSIVLNIPMYDYSLSLPPYIYS